MSNLHTCKAIIKSGPRKGRECGRVCFGQEYCFQYHRRFIREDIPQPTVPVRESRESREWKNIIELYRSNPQGRQEAIANIAERYRGHRPPFYGTIAVQPVLPVEQVEQKVSQTEINMQKKCFEELTKNENTGLFCCFFPRRKSSLSVKEYKEDCAICTSAARSQEIWIETPCNHKFHVECIKSWINTFGYGDKGCPLCRRKIKEKIRNGFIVR
jgi:hypothetical protein